MEGIKSQRWEEIIQHYKQSPSMKPMLNLIDYITNSKYRFSLRGIVFMNDLVISVTEPINLFEFCLHLSWKESENKFEAICYYSSKDRKPDWETAISADNMKPMFDKLIENSKWY